MLNVTTRNTSRSGDSVQQAAKRGPRGSMKLRARSRSRTATVTPIPVATIASAASHTRRLRRWAPPIP